MDAVQPRGKISAAVSFDIPGMGYKNPGTGKIEGFEADLSRAIAEKLFGSPDAVDVVQAIDAHRIDSLESGEVDMVVSQLTITPDRAAEVDFSTPYLVTGEGLLVLAGSSIKGLDDLAGKRIAVVDGSISLRRMRTSLPSLPGATLILTPLSYGGLEALAKGEADAVSNDLINLTMMRASTANPDRFVIVDISDRFERKPFGVAVKKGRTDLVDRLNQAIDSLKASGDIDRLLRESIAALGAGS